MRWVQALVMTFKGYAIASVVAMLTILIVTGDPETVAAGALVPLFLLPSIVLFAALAVTALAPRWKHVGYLIPALGTLSLTMVSVAMDEMGYIQEGNGIPALVAITFGSPAVVTYLWLLKVTGAGAPENRVSTGASANPQTYR